MDSLTQIVLGAAMGEAVAGKKIGSRAMLWGAVGGTIPDLDVLSSFFTDEMTALAFHRGFMHSILFALIAPWGLAWLTHRFYKSGVYKKQKFKIGAMILGLVLLGAVVTGINAIPVLLGKSLSVKTLLFTILPAAWLSYLLWTRYYQKGKSDVNASYLTWVLLFFISIFTHPILDCFTGYGTQLFAPFSDFRVQWGTVFVVDPMYTIPFVICLIVASRKSKTDPKRAWWNWAGIIWSCAYLAFTVYHKVQVNDVFAQSLQEQNIEYNRFSTGPTPLNNILWSGMVESDSLYYYGQWGFNDPTNRVTKFLSLPKNHEELKDVNPDDRNLKILKWFSDGYFNVIQRDDSTLQFNDLRFGIMGDTVSGPKSYVFPFIIKVQEGGKLDAHHIREVDPEDGKKILDILWRRIRGEV